MATEAAACGSHRHPWWRRAGWLLGLALCLPLAAQPLGNRERQVEAAFLVNFVRYAEWPRQRFTGEGDPYVIAVVGSQDATDTVAAIARAAGPIQGRRIEVRRVDLDVRGARREAAARRLRAAHVAFLSSDAATTAEQLLGVLDGAPVLTVSDVPGFVEAGGMLGLVRAGPHMAFEANPRAINACGLGLSAKVLKLARIREPVP
ncbi:MAG TPA: YfiR family protein [Luteimonas sp.]|nr:YfiR family protein [Luteimonas sp.]